MFTYAVVVSIMWLLPVEGVLGHFSTEVGRQPDLPSPPEERGQSCSKTLVIVNAHGEQTQSCGHPERTDVGSFDSLSLQHGDIFRQDSKVLGPLQSRGYDTGREESRCFFRSNYPEPVDIGSDTHESLLIDRQFVAFVASDRGDCVVDAQPTNRLDSGGTG